MFWPPSLFSWALDLVEDPGYHTFSSKFKLEAQAFEVPRPGDGKKIKISCEDSIP